MLSSVVKNRKNNYFADFIDFKQKKHILEDLV